MSTAMAQRGLKAKDYSSFSNKTAPVQQDTTADVCLRDARIGTYLGQLALKRVLIYNYPISIWVASNRVSDTGC